VFSFKVEHLVSENVCRYSARRKILANIPQLEGKTEQLLSVRDRNGNC
jgi:hypothetical protein